MILRIVGTTRFVSVFDTAFGFCALLSSNSDSRGRRHRLRVHMLFEVLIL